MSRSSLDPTMQGALEGPQLAFAILCMLTFADGVRYCWSGVGNLIYNGNTYLGVGSLGSIGDVQTGLDVESQGTTITLSGIDPVYLGESLTDIQIGAPAKIMWAIVNPATMAIVGAPYVLYAGTVDAPTVTLGTDTCSISLKIENRMANLQRAQQQRYTAASQRLLYPNDTGFNWVEIQNDEADLWGS